MGITTSSPELTQEQLDCKYLGDRIPFGDVEILSLYKSYQQFRSCYNSDNTNTSFLQLWSTARQQQTTTTTTTTTTEVIEFIEESILPKQFGNALYKHCFCDATANSQQQQQQERFFLGLSNCCRRGNQQSIPCIFHALSVSEESTTTTTISAFDFITVGYRLAIACSILSTQTTTSPTNDATTNDAVVFNAMMKKKAIQDILDSSSSSSSSKSYQQLRSLSNSMVAKRKTRLERYGALHAATTDDDDQVELQDVLEWCEHTGALYGNILSTFFHYITFPGTTVHTALRGRTVYTLPILSTTTTTSGNDTAKKNAAHNNNNTILNHSTKLFSVSVMSQHLLSPTYHCVYSSAVDGLSFNRLQNAILGYGGPTLFVIQSTDGAVFGACTGTSWKESKDFYGTSDCFLYQLYPRTAVYHPKGGGSASSKNIMYCNSTARSRGYDQQAHGIGFGGTVHAPRLFLDESFDQCCAKSQDLTFDNGALGPAPHFDIDVLEVWGVGNDDVVQRALEARQMKRDVTSAAIAKARKVDKAQFLDDFRSGTFGTNKNFKHRTEVDGRASEDLRQNDTK